MTNRFLAILVLVWTMVSPLRADRAADFAALTNGLAGGVTLNSGSQTGIVTGEDESWVPVLTQTRPEMALVAGGVWRTPNAGVPAARAVTIGHSQFAYSAADSSMFKVVTNALSWVSRPAANTPAAIAQVGGNATIATRLGTAGFTVTRLAAGFRAADLVNADGSLKFKAVYWIETSLDADSRAALADFFNRGGGLVHCATYWSNGDRLKQENEVLNGFGLFLTTDWTYPGASAWPVSATVASPLHSGVGAMKEIRAYKDGTVTKTLDELKNLVWTADYLLWAGGGYTSQMVPIYEELCGANYFGWVAPTAANPVNKVTEPLDAMMVRYQSAKFDRLPSDQLFAHPSAADFPGSVPMDTPPVTRTFHFNGNTPQNDGFMEQSWKPYRFETGLYVLPGQQVTITIPAQFVDRKFQVHIAPNGGEDVLFSDKDSWNYYPKLWRRVPLNQTVTTTGSVLGGLVTILIPSGLELGDVEVTVAGAIQAPAYFHGETTEAEWLAGLRTSPAPYGLIQTEKLTLYVPAWLLKTLSNPEQVANYWKEVMDLADEYYGYSFRTRREVISPYRYVSWGGAYAGYPIEMGWGTNSDAMLNAVVNDGSWGIFHELGHTFQANFKRLFTFEHGIETDVNLLPGLLYEKLHDRSPWENSHVARDWAWRLERRAVYMALPEAERTWQKANEMGPISYDFYYNMAESFGWEMYRTVFTRYMRYLRNPSAQTDAELHSISGTGGQLIRDRMYFLMCTAAERNLDDYFQSYGLGASDPAATISASVKSMVAAKNFPVWNGNTPIEDLVTEGPIVFQENLPAGSVIGQLKTIDLEDPGQMLEYEVTGGNADGAFSIDRRTGALRAQPLDLENASAATRELTVRVKDCGVPRFEISRQITVELVNVIEPPQVPAAVVSVRSAQAAQTVVGTVPLVVDAGSRVALIRLSGPGAENFQVNGLGEIRLVNPGQVPASGTQTLVLEVTDALGQTTRSTVLLVFGKDLGLRERRWWWEDTTAAPYFTGHQPTFRSAIDIADDFTRHMDGWVVPPVSGEYTFWYCTDDRGALNLGTGAEPASARRIASTDAWVPADTWHWYPSQKSTTIFLQAGQPYWIHGTQVEGGGGDHMMAAWSGPGFAREIIPQRNLIPPDAVPANTVPGQDLAGFDAWAGNRFASNSSLSTSEKAAEGDPNGNGLSNIMEYALGREPLAAAGSGAVSPVQGELVEGRLELEFSFNALAKDLILDVQASETLQGDWVNLARSQGGAAFVPLRAGVSVSQDQAGALSRVRVRDASPGSPAPARRFLRLRVQRQP